MCSVLCHFFLRERTRHAYIYVVGYFGELYYIYFPSSCIQFVRPLFVTQYINNCWPYY